MQVSVIIVTYNDYENTYKCIQSVIDHTKDLEYEIILVDNCSTSVSTSCFTDDFPQIKLVQSKFNGGFAHANNLGLRIATGEIVLLLNNDTILHENSVKKCYDQLLFRPYVGVIGCRMVFPDGKLQYTARNFKTIKWEILDTFRFLLLFIPAYRRSWLMLGKYFKHDISIHCDWVNGAFFMFRRKLLMYLPGEQLDNRFYMSGEDQLWCEQIQKLGYGVFFYADTTITHICGASRNDKMKEIKFRSKMFDNEMEVMSNRKKWGWYLLAFWLLYGIKEKSRTAIKLVYYKATKKLIQ